MARSKFLVFRVSGASVDFKADKYRYLICYARTHMEQALLIAVLIISIVIHEVAHGHAANWLGDPTARLQGRLSMNPIVHIDLLGSIIIPALMIMGNTGFLFGWAKPVPYNPYNLRNQKWGEAIVAAAGPAVNLLIALIFALVLRAADPLALSLPMISIIEYIVYINLLLMCFNLLPLPPLDGSKILKALLPFKAARSYQQFLYTVESYGLFAAFATLFIFMYVLAAPFSVFMSHFFTLLTGRVF